MQRTSSTPSETIRIQRNFQDISDGKVTDYEQAYIWSDLGLHRSFRWDVLLKSRRVLIISEAGSGKTYECQTEQGRLWNLGEPAFYIELSELSCNKLDDLFNCKEQERFDAWLSSQSDIATFFLDSIDELKLSLGSFAGALKKLNKALAGQLGRVRIIITTRPVSIDISLVHKHLPALNTDEPVVVSGESFADLMMPRRKQNISPQKPKEEDIPEFRTVALMPFSDTQIRQMAIMQGVTNADELLDDIHKRNAEEFARRPQDLIELCTDWRAHNRIRTHKEQVAHNIKIKLSPRTERPEKTPLSETKAFEGASRLALAALLTHKLTFRHSAEADRSGEPGTTLDPASILPDWSSDERSVLLERPLFGFANYGRVRFHHRSVVEYLAAKRLEYMRNNGISMKALKRLLFAETLQKIKVIKPSMRPVAAWLALTQPAIFSEIRDREPNVLLDYGDPESLTIQQRVDALSNYIERYGKGNWRGLNPPNIQVHRFGSVELSDITVRLWSAGIENPEVRELILGLIEVVPMPIGADIAYSVIRHYSKNIID